MRTLLPKSVHGKTRYICNCIVHPCPYRREVKTNSLQKLAAKIEARIEHLWDEDLRAIPKGTETYGRISELCRMLSETRKIEVKK